MHYRNKRNKTCRFTELYKSGALGVWTACGETAAKGE
jgi:hypothetical protein